MIECALANSVGDSGGPVVNRAGELVGMVCYGDVQPIRAVGVAEVRAFLKGEGQ